MEDYFFIFVKKINFITNEANILFLSLRKANILFLSSRKANILFLSSKKANILFLSSKKANILFLSSRKANILFLSSQKANILFLFCKSLFFRCKNINDLKNIKSKEINEWMKAKFKYDFNHVRKNLNQG